MKVCFVMSGVPHYVTLLLNKLSADHGVEVTLIKPAARSQSVGSGVHEDASQRRFRLIELEEYRTAYGKPFLRGMEDALAEVQPQVLILGWPYVLAVALSPAFWRFLQQRGIRFVYRDIPFNLPPWGQVREYYFGDQILSEDFSSAGGKTWPGFLRFWLTAAVRRRYIRRAAAHIMYTDAAYDIIGSYGVSREKIFVTANSPDTDELLAAFEQVKCMPPLLPPNAQRLIHVGRLVKWKRVDLLIESVRRLQGHFPQIELVVVGKGPEEEALRQQAASSGVAQRVRFVGGVYDPLTLGQYLHASAIYVLAGMGGLSINDAMCFAKPVVCSVADGTEKRLVREGYNGHYFSNGDADSLSERLAGLLANPARMQQFGQNSLHIIQHDINIHTVLEAYVRAFEYAIR
ncbi:MAG TPA: glycosyltransferase family 4 protein [Saprospiraceae bacterium]|nr:glycosyltransferase family 4 protein [Saprospiraceae bacterium]HND87506.1 glycosyltransferase family 4 protein [Saprospiraceae bacterium]